jgi:hypothetical protein
VELSALVPPGAPRAVATVSGRPLIALTSGLFEHTHGLSSEAGWEAQDPVLRTGALAGPGYGKRLTACVGAPETFVVQSATGAAGGFRLARLDQAIALP